VIRSTLWCLSTVACYFWMPLGKCYLGKTCYFSYLVAGDKIRKEERKKEDS
jgi:hypothetical protein